MTAAGEQFGRFRPDETDLPDLPSGWCWATLAELAAPERNAITDGPFGSKLKTAHYTESGARVIRLQNVGDAVFRDAKAFVSLEHYASLEKHRVRGGDLVIAALGEELPRACVVPDWIGPAIVKADCIRFGPDTAVISAHYLNYALNLRATRLRTASVIHGVGRPRLNLKEIKDIRIPVAPTGTQDRIVAAVDELLSDLGAGVEALERVRAKLGVYRATVLRAAVEGELTAVWRKQHLVAKEVQDVLTGALAARRRRWERTQLRKFRDARRTPPGNWKSRYKEPSAPDLALLAPLPTGWSWVALDQIAEIAGGVTKGQKFSDNEKIRPVPYLRVANVQRGYLDLSEIKEIPAREADIDELRLQPGDVLFNEGGDRDKLGRGWVWEGQIVECIHQNHVFRARLVLPEILPKFVSWCGNSYGQLWFMRAGRQSVNLASINLTVLRAFPIPLPPAEEQEAVVEAVEDQLSVIDHLEADIEAKLEAARVLRQSILSRAFSGQLVPQDPNDEPASKLLERIANERRARAQQTDATNHGNHARKKAPRRRAPVPEANPAP